MDKNNITSNKEKVKKNEAMIKQYKSQLASSQSISDDLQTKLQDEIEENNQLKTDSGVEALKKKLQDAYDAKENDLILAKQVEVDNLKQYYKDQFDSSVENMANQQIQTEKDICQTQIDAINTANSQAMKDQNDKFNALKEQSVRSDREKNQSIEQKTEEIAKQKQLLKDEQDKYESDGWVTLNYNINASGFAPRKRYNHFLSQTLTAKQALKHCHDLNKKNRYDTSRVKKENIFSVKYKEQDGNKVIDSYACHIPINKDNLNTTKPEGNSFSIKMPEMDVFGKVGEKESFKEISKSLHEEFKKSLDRDESCKKTKCPPGWYSTFDMGLGKLEDDTCKNTYMHRGQEQTDILPDGTAKDYSSFDRLKIYGLQRKALKNMGAQNYRYNLGFHNDENLVLSVDMEDQNKRKRTYDTKGVLFPSCDAYMGGYPKSFATDEEIDRANKDETYYNSSG